MSETPTNHDASTPSSPGNEAVDTALATVTAPDQSAPAMIEIPVPLRIETCPQCSVIFALPLDIFLQRVADKGEIHCCNGHVIKLARRDSNAGIIKTSIRLLAELKQSKYEADRLRNILARMPRPPAKAIDENEFLRRVSWIENRAARTAYGRLLCRFCERPRSRLRSHLKTDHRQAIENLPPEFFD